MVDFSNGSDLELPPNGRASPEGIKNALDNIASFFSDPHARSGACWDGRCSEECIARSAK